MPPQFQNNVPPENNPTLLESPRKHTFLIVLAVLLILTGIFGVWYFLNPLPEDQTETTAIVNKFTDWKTYTNTEYGFEFKYPSTYTVKIFDKPETPEDLFEIIINGPARGQYMGPPSWIDISVWNNSKQLSLLDWAKANSIFSNYGLDPAFPNNDFKNEALSGHKAISYGWVGMDYNRTVIIENSQTILLLETGADSKTDQVWQDFGSILSTFKFISTSTPANNL